MKQPRLGKRQLELLAQLGSPSMLLVTPDKVSDGLVRLGYARSDRGADAACCITPAGLRALAEEMEAGRLKDALQLAEERRAKAAANTTGGDHA